MGIKKQLYLSTSKYFLGVLLCAFVSSCMVQDSGVEEAVCKSFENFNKVYLELPIYDIFFVRAGLAEIDVNTTEVASGNGGSYGNTSLDGDVLGIGIKGDVGSNMGYKIFYEQTDFDTLKLTSSGNSVASETNALTADLDVSELKFALSFKF